MPRVPSPAHGRPLALLLALLVGACAPAAPGSPQPAARSAPAASAPVAAPAAVAPAATAPASSPQPDALRALVEAARAEGQLNLVWNPGTIGTEADIQRFAQG